ncbi:hypothetical protein ABZY09_47585 [Streptomyces sp. NPDC002928]|uniref:hypothetical protein n=1 Tax=Streptomyces sp. NPDC002928 TaxID=3154440 RepID=UPI0033B64D28
MSLRLYAAARLPGTELKKKAFTPFADPGWRMPQETGFFQPLLVARREEVVPSPGELPRTPAAPEAGASST